MFLQTPRLIWVSTPLNVVRLTLERRAFTAEVPLAEGVKNVYFPTEWPGDALVIFPHIATELEKNPEHERRDGALIEKATNTAIGQLGCKGLVDENGSVDIGYGLSPVFQGHGYATEMVGALTAWLLEQPSVSLVKAACLETNIASVACSRKPGCKSVGKKASNEGPLLLWAKGT